METAFAQEDNKKRITKKGSQYVSLEEFFAQYSNREDNFKYEWIDGEIEKTHKTMNQEQTAIFLFLLRIFMHTEAFKNGGGLTSETDMYTSERQLRKPDIAFYSGKQIEKMKKGDAQLPAWVAEVISEHDNANQIDAKVDEYFNAGVKVVWQIFPKLKTVKVYTSPLDSKICRGEILCSGAPILPDFAVKAGEIFE